MTEEQKIDQAEKELDALARSYLLAESQHFAKQTPQGQAYISDVWVSGYTVRAAEEIPQIRLLAAEVVNVLSAQKEYFKLKAMKQHTAAKDLLVKCKGYEKELYEKCKSIIEAKSTEP